MDHSCAGELLSNLKYFKWFKGVDISEDASTSVSILEKPLMGVVIGIYLHTGILFINKAFVRVGAKNSLILGVTYLEGRHTQQQPFSS